MVCMFKVCDVSRHRFTWQLGVSMKTLGIVKPYQNWKPSHYWMLNLSLSDVVKVIEKAHGK